MTRHHKKLHSEKIRDDGWWACQRPNEFPQPLLTFFEEECKDCTAIAQQFVREQLNGNLGVALIRRENRGEEVTMRVGLTIEEARTAEPLPPEEAKVLKDWFFPIDNLGENLDG